LDICFPLRRLTLLALLVLICICVKSEVVYHTLILCHRTTTSFTLLILVRGSGKIAATVLYPCFLILDPCLSSPARDSDSRHCTIYCTTPRSVCYSCASPSYLALPGTILAAYTLQCFKVLARRTCTNQQPSSQPNLSRSPLHSKSNRDEPRNAGNGGYNVSLSVFGHVQPLSKSCGCTCSETWICRCRCCATLYT